jgi:aminoglycoside phosphotransferase (APT) family kinase protein
MARTDQTPLISTEMVRRLVKQQFPQWGDMPIVAVVPGGWDNRTFRLGNDMLVRMPSAAAYAPQAEKEHQWLPRLAPFLPLPIPTPLALGAPSRDYPWQWSILSWIEGQAASLDLIHNLVSFARALAQFLTAFQRAPAAGGPVPGQSNFYRGGAIQIYEAETVEAINAISGQIDASAALSIWHKAIASSWQREPVWLHGDLALSNLIVRDGCLAGVIDFGNMAIGDPACDLTIAWTAFDEASRENFRATLQLDENTWARAKGWALWKAAITVADPNTNQHLASTAWRTINEIISDQRLNASGSVK